MLRRKKLQITVDLTSVDGTCGVEGAALKTWACLQLTPNMQVPRWKNGHTERLLDALVPEWGVPRIVVLGEAEGLTGGVLFGCSKRQQAPCEHRPC